jgi:hypothetical protein
MRGWSLTPLMGSDPETLAERMAVKVEWLTRIAAYPHLDDTSNREELEAEVETFEKEMVATLNNHAKAIQLCTCSRCW